MTAANASNAALSDSALARPSVTCQRQQAQLSPRDPRDALYQLTCCPTVVEITQTYPPCQPEKHFQELPRFIRLPALLIVKVKVGLLYSAVYVMTGPARFTISELRKWQLIGKSQWCCSANCGHPIACVNVQLDRRRAASKHTTAPINHTRPSPVSIYQTAPPV